MPKEATGPLRIPKTVRFPFGYTVKIVQKTLNNLRNDTGEEVYGYWDVETQTIFIGKDLPAAKKRYILGHELKHALEDWLHEYLEIGAMGV